MWCGSIAKTPEPLLQFVDGVLKVGPVSKVPPEDADHAVECLGKAMVCAAGYAYHHGLALAPILDLARALTRRDDVQPVHGVTRLAALERSDDVRPERVVAALGLCIAKGIDDCEIVHGLTIEPHGVFLTIGREMLAAEEKTKIDSLLADILLIAQRQGVLSPAHVGESAVEQCTLGHRP